MHRTAYVLLFLTALFWGGNAIAGKLAVGHVSPVLLTALRWSLAFLLVTALGLGPLRRDWPAIRRNLPFLFALGAAGFALFNIALYGALIFTSAINVMIEQAAMPMFIFAANFLLFSTRVTAAQALGFALSLVGVALTAAHGDLRRLLQLDVNAGDALMLVAVILYGGYTVALRYRPPIAWQSMMSVLSASAALSSLPFLAWEIGAGHVIWPDATGWAVVAYTVLFPSLLSQVFFMRGVEMIGANRAGLFVNIVPVVGAGLSILILGEDLHLYHGLAMILVLGGIWLAERSGRRMAE